MSVYIGFYYGDTSNINHTLHGERGLSLYVFNMRLFLQIAYMYAYIYIYRHVYVYAITVHKYEHIQTNKHIYIRTRF